MPHQLNARFVDPPLTVASHILREVGRSLFPSLPPSDRLRLLAEEIRHVGRKAETTRVSLRNQTC